MRNHGPVPNYDALNILDWSISIEGLVETPLTVTLGDIMTKFQQVTLPLTLVCAGNRRKEQNIVQKTNGFSWGAGGVSTALFTGVLLAKVLELSRPTSSAKYLCMEGADSLPHGNYGTSIRLSLAMNPASAIMLAYMMDGEMLTPDHGRPLRAVVPGQIGGRSVKWLKRLIVTETPSENWYHLNDNKVLPTTITPEVAAEKPSWWAGDRYAIFSFNVNSAILKPAHDEVLTIMNQDDYAFQGYAYSGGGRRVTRVELSIDDGKSWILATIQYDEDRYRNLPKGTVIYGGLVDIPDPEACYCWCLWTVTVSTDLLSQSAAVLVRAMDDSMLVQPRVSIHVGILVLNFKDIYWNVLGMMNNPWYRVVIHKEGDALRFEHPTQPGVLDGGWMSRTKKAGGDLMDGRWGDSGVSNQTAIKLREEPVQMTNSSVNRVMSRSEIESCNPTSEALFILDGHVYDGTPFLKDHPGGEQSIILAAGTDVTDDFLAIHSDRAKKMMHKYQVGVLEASQLATNTGQITPSNVDVSCTFLDQKLWKSSRLMEMNTASSDSRQLILSLASKDQPVGLPCGQHILLKLEHKSSKQTTIRAYTPVSRSHIKGKIELLVKLYPFVEGKDSQVNGKMSEAIRHLQINDEIMVKGPLGEFQYLGKGRVHWKGTTRTISKFVMVSAGSGITPIFNILQEVILDEADPTSCNIFYGNRTEHDILLEQELSDLSNLRPDRCQIIHTISQPSALWTGRRGRLSKEMLSEYLPFPQKSKTAETLILCCGPPALEAMVRKTCDDPGWPDLVFF